MKRQLGLHRSRGLVAIGFAGALVAAFALGISPSAATVTGDGHSKTLLAPRQAIHTADSTGPVEIDSKGNGYVAWTGPDDNNGSPIEFCVIPKAGMCKKPLVLPLSTGDHWDDYDITQAFPVLGGNKGVVLVVGPSYVYSDVVVWTSSNGGKSFPDPQVIPSPSYAGDTGVDDVLRSPITTDNSLNYFSIASTNPGLGYSFTGTGSIGAMDPPSGFTYDNTDKVPGAVDGATLGFSGQQTIEPFWTDANPPRLAYYWAPGSGASGEQGSYENGPYVITDGSNARLAGGPKGLFLLSEDGSQNAKQLKLHVRKWDPSSHTFGAPTKVGEVPNDINATNPGGFTEDAATGQLVVAWPTDGPSGSYVIRVWTSTNGGSSFGKSTIESTIGYAYDGPVRIATRNGMGFLTYQDSHGLDIVDLSKL